MLLRARMRGVEARVQRLADALDDELDVGLYRATERAAQEARASHPYQNRTGDLEASTRAVEPRGRFMAGDLRGYVVATEAYASYVDGRPEYEFLLPAWVRAESAADHAMDAALRRATRRAGWS